MNAITNVFRRIMGRGEKANQNNGQSSAENAIRDTAAIGQRPAVDQNLVASLMSVQKAPKIATDKPFDIQNHRFGVEIEVAAPKGVDNPDHIPTHAEVKHLMDKGYKFNIDGVVLKTDDGKKIEGGKPESDPARVLQVALAEPERLVATDPNTGEHHKFDDSDDRKLNRQYFSTYVNFKTFMEDKVRPAMDGIGWIAEDTVDCQAHAGVDEAVRYIEVKNQISTIASGGKEAVKQAVKFLREIGCTTHPACALQYHVDMTQMPREKAMDTMKNMLKIELENENVLYRVAQNGDPQHRGLLTGFRFCLPLAAQPITPFLHAQTPDELKNFWYNDLFPGGENKDDPKERPTGPYHNSRYYGTNFHSYWYRGSVETRYYNTTLDEDVACAHLDLSLGIAAAAYNGDADWKGIHPLGWDPAKPPENVAKFQVGNNQPVGREQIQSFLDRTVQDGPARKVLLNMFFQGGGKVADIPEDKDIKTADAMMKQGYVFKTHISDLGVTLPALDAVEAVDGLRQLHYDLTVEKPGTSLQANFNNGDDLHRFLQEQSGNIAHA